jgi:hypothetical protein
LSALAPLLGCWHRRSIRFADGREDTATRVVWLQTEKGLADLRIPGDRPDLSHRTGLDDCTQADLLALAEQDAMCGVTLFDPDAEPHPTATWPADGNLLRFQPVTAFPEPGWLSWQDGGATMIEQAPSGAYVEDWRRQPGSDRQTEHRRWHADGRLLCLYVAGDHAVLARARVAPIAERRRLPELAHEAAHDLPRLRRLLDCEFSYARREAAGEPLRIVLSTLPWQEGRTLSSP